MKFRSGVFGLTVTAALALAVSANAADMYQPAAGGYKDAPAPASIWSGFYLGLNGGYGWQNKTADVTNTFIGFPNVDITNGFAAAGGFGGGQIGYNWQGRVLSPHVVVGVEADIQGSGIRDSFSQNNSPGSGLFPYDDVFHSKASLDWFGTARARLGYAFDRTLVYATGGFAYGSVNQQITAINDAHQLFEDVHKDGLRTGFVLGGGAEYLIAPAWSVKAEYQYMDLGSSTMTGTDPLMHSPMAVSSVSNTFNTVRAGINYHVGQTYEPLK